MTNYSIQKKTFYMLAYTPPELNGVNERYILIAQNLGIFNPATDIWLNGLRTREHSNPDVPNSEISGSDLLDLLKQRGRKDRKSAIVCSVVPDFNSLEDLLIKFYLQNGFEIHRDGLNIFARCEL